MKNDNLIKQLDEAIRAGMPDSDVKTWSLKYLKSHQNRYLVELNQLESLVKGGDRVLEIGSAPFHMTYLLSKSGYRVNGWDIGPERFENFIKVNDLTIERVNIETDSVAGRSNHFDVILFNEVFEHLRMNPIETLQKICSMLVPKGLLMLSTPNLNSFGNLLSFVKGKGFDNPYREFNKLNTIGHMGHVREYTAEQVCLFLENTGFDIQKVRYLDFGNTPRGLNKYAILKMIYKSLPSRRPFFQIIARKK
jgi:2-polyprenyl-3-methyl-5-hydroxy-6-metoxy-1,4-benzoquinol methylase